jgi:hypothetical protein
MDRGIVMLKCNTCGATYDREQPNGMRYFHACGPLTGRELAAALDAGTVTLTDDQARLLRAAQARDQAQPPKAGDPSRARLVLESFYVDRPHARDENLVSTLEKHAGSIKADGAGVTELD